MIMLITLLKFVQLFLRLSKLQKEKYMQWYSHTDIHD